MLEKKVTRKQFLLSIASFAAVIVAAKIPNVPKSIGKKGDKTTNSYGNFSYGGKTNA